ncbi:hypothetical protein NHX12_023513 [Muraenolepis orangiensis]|uniref:Uncharacterized protein n=1 Tax=Muraenolepis orangiensis TaxID=630683 RepID=A0A9Q0EK99_9TELE|nr:hypothetical protein NHX12_023513 [Muraenolepis orangiensis]
MSCGDASPPHVPPSSLLACANQEKEESHHDNIKLEQKVVAAAQPVKKGKKLTSSGCHDDEKSSVEYTDSSGVDLQQPEQRFLQQIREEKIEEIQQWKAILPRDNTSEDQLVHHSLREKQSRSMEEREEDYYREEAAVPAEPREHRTESDSSYHWKSAAPKPRHAVGHAPDTRGAAGQPFLNPDGTPAVYIPPDSQQPIRSQAHLSAPPLQQPQPQMVQYSSVSYAPPSQAYSTMEDLNTQFAHVASSSQVPMYYYSGQYPTSAPQTCRPPSPNQQLHNQAGVQPIHSQAQSMLGNYSPMAAHQCGVSQAPGSVSYAPGGVVVPLGGEYCCVGPPPCAPMAPPTHPGNTCQGPGCFSMQPWGGQY